MQKNVDEMSLIADMVEAAMLENTLVALDQKEYQQKNDALAAYLEEVKRK